jgi:6-phosphogluconolactonase/glucosamine-6-phosphate isomerase/deaminase
MQIIITDNKEKGIERAKEEIYNRVDNKTVLFLSGGTTPKLLYELFVKESILFPAEAAMIDERYGKPFHQNSNQKMIADTGLLQYFSDHNIPFHTILSAGLSREKTAKAYDGIVRNIFFHFTKSVGILGIGKDGHTAGIAPNRKDFINPLFKEKRRHTFVDEFNDTNGSFKERITLTFAGLSLLDFIIVLVFGKDKKEALTKACMQGSLEDVPARFFISAEMVKKTLFITDQKI